MVEIKEFDRGETIRINNTFTDIDDVAFDPTTVELKIYDPAGTLIETVTYAADEIKKSSTGVYYYDYAIAADATVGWDITKWIGVASGFSDVSKGQFKIIDPELKNYVTVNEVWNRAGVDSTVASHDEVLPLIKDSMAEIDSIYQKNFKYSNDVTEWFDTDQPDINTVVNTLFLMNTPVRAITSIKEYDTDGNEVADYEAADYRVDLKTGRVKLKSKEFGHDEDRVCVIYTYGHDTIPEKISTLCGIMSAMRLLVLQIGTTYDDVTSYGACGLCLCADTKILTKNGYKPIITLENENVSLINKNGVISDGKVWCSGEKEVIELILNNGDAIKCTPEHIFMLEDLSSCCAIDLLNKRLSLYDSDENIMVIEINLVGIEKVYDFYEPLTNWGVINNGVIVHNSISVGEPAANMEKSLIKLKDERSWLLAEIGRLRPSVLIV